MAVENVEIVEKETPRNFHVQEFPVGVKAKPECCREQNRNTGNGPVKRASAIDNASFVLFSCSYRIPRPPWGADRPVLRAKPEKVYTITHETTNR